MEWNLVRFEVFAGCTFVLGYMMIGRQNSSVSPENQESLDETGKPDQLAEEDKRDEVPTPFHQKFFRAMCCQPSTVAGLTRRLPGSAPRKPHSLTDPRQVTMKHHSGIYFYDEYSSEILQLSGGDCCQRGESTTSEAAEQPANKDLSGAYKVRFSETSIIDLSLLSPQTKLWVENPKPRSYHPLIPLVLAVY